MDTYLKRGQVVVYFALTALFCFAMLSHASVYWRVPNTPITFINPRIESLQQVQKYIRRADGATGKQPGDRAVIMFDLDADLTDVFDWNVKQLFVYITAQYQISNRPKNEVTIWDSIVNSTAHAHIRLKDVRSEYDVFDPHSQLKGTPVILTLYWDVMPTIGLLKTGASTGLATAITTGAGGKGGVATTPPEPVKIIATAYETAYRSPNPQRQ